MAVTCLVPRPRNFASVKHDLPPVRLRYVSDKSPKSIEIEDLLESHTGTRGGKFLKKL